MRSIDTPQDALHNIIRYNNNIYKAAVAKTTRLRR
eukprot:SAG31_NODE_14792_length_787_cov_1.308140_1_plen_34_part_10